MADRTYMAVSLWRTYMDGLETNIIGSFEPHDSKFLSAS